jgi:glycosyltransferase involved in cell wall biosynthesis
LWPDLVRVTKTEWTRRMVREHAGVDCAVAGPSVDLDLFRPRPRRGPDWPRRPLRVAAMVRPESPRRQPELTMDVLRAVARAHGGRVEAVAFGVAPDHPAFRRLRRDFAFRNVGVLPPARMAHLLNEVDIFADFSAFQAMGLTALEAMACGAAVIVPAAGGSRSFARPDVNCLEAEAGSAEACQAVLERLITDHDLRARLARQALADAVRFHPEQAAFRVLDALWPEAGPC